MAVISFLLSCLALWQILDVKVSISSTFYAHIFCTNVFLAALSKLHVSRKSCQKRFSYIKFAHLMLMKLTHDYLRFVFNEKQTLIRMKTHLTHELLFSLKYNCKVQLTINLINSGMFFFLIGKIFRNFFFRIFDRIAIGFHSDDIYTSDSSNSKR